MELEKQHLHFLDLLNVNQCQLMITKYKHIDSN